MGASIVSSKVRKMIEQKEDQERATAAAPKPETPGKSYTSKMAEKIIEERNKYEATQVREGIENSETKFTKMLIKKKDTKVEVLPMTANPFAKSSENTNTANTKKDIFEELNEVKQPKQNLKKKAN